MAPLTFLGALRTSGLTAPCVFDGPINGEAFRAWVGQFLLPVLKPDDIVVMDNLGSPEGREVRQLIPSASARLWFLTAYWPDLNPIEQTFPKIKQAMRTTQKHTIDEVIHETGKSCKTSVHPNAETISSEQVMLPPKTEPLKVPL